MTGALERLASSQYSNPTSVARDAALVAQGDAWAGPAPRIMFLGDSNTAGSNGIYTGLVGGYPARTIESLLAVRADFEVIGSQILVPENASGCSVFYSEGHPGDTIATLTAGYAGYVASPGVGVPDVVVVMAGTNDMVAGRTLVQIQGDYAALLAQIHASGPRTQIVWMAPPVFVDGTTTHATLAALQALQASVVAWMAGWAPAQPLSRYSPASQLPGQGNFIVDGVHWNLSGQGLAGNALGVSIDAWMGARSGTPIPRAFLTRQPWASEHCITAATDGLSCTAHPGFNPGAGSFTLAVSFYLASVPLAGTYSIATYGLYAVNNYYSVLLVSDGTTASVRVYWEDTAATIAGAASSFGEVPGLKIGMNRLVLSADASTGTVGLGVNGDCAGLKQGLAPWTNTQQTFYLGLEPTFGAGAPGYYSQVQAYKAVPARPGSVAWLQAIRADYYQAASLAAAGSAYFTLDGTLVDDVYAPGNPNPPMVIVGAMAAAGAFPGGTPLFPWNQPH